MARSEDKSNGTGNTALQHAENQTAVINLTNRTPMETNFRIPTADLFSCGLSRCCCQFSHQGVLRSGLFALLFLSLSLPLTRGGAFLRTVTGPSCPLWEEVQPGSATCFNFSGKQTNQPLSSKEN